MTHRPKRDKYLHMALFRRTLKIAPRSQTVSPSQSVGGFLMLVPSRVRDGNNSQRQDEANAIQSGCNSPVGKHETDTLCPCPPRSDRRAAKSRSFGRAPGRTVRGVTLKRPTASRIGRKGCDASYRAYIGRLTLQTRGNSLRRLLPMQGLYCGKTLSPSSRRLGAALHQVIS